VDVPIAILPVHAVGGGSPNAGKVLVLSRHSGALDGRPKEFWILDGQEDTIAEAQQGQLTHYATRLLPGATYALGGDDSPAALEECTAIMTLDQIYEPCGIYEEAWRNERVSFSVRPLEHDDRENSPFIITNNYIYYMAWSAVQLFDVTDPSNSMVHDITSRNFFNKELSLSS